MCLASSIWHSTKCYLTWKVSVTKQGRSVFRLVPSAPRTGATGFGFWPTPDAGMTQGGRTLPEGTTPTGQTPDGRKVQVGLTNAVKLWPTPTQSDGMGGPGSSGRDGGENLWTAIGGSLNPQFVEWLQGYPKDWTKVE